MLEIQQKAPAVRDLFSQKENKNLHIGLPEDGTIIPQGLQLKFVKDYNSFKSIYEAAAAKFSQVATKQNETGFSSSANVFTIIQIQKKTSTQDGADRVTGITKSSITFVDMVGEHKR